MKNVTLTLWATYVGTIFVVWLICSQVNGQQVVLESAALGATGRIGGASVTIAQFIGWRFETSVPLSVEQVGGHMLAIPEEPGDIFAAIVHLPSIDAMPLGAPFTPEEVLATTTFRPLFPSDEVLTPLSATLRPGAYALVYGTGQFGATGAAAMHNGPDQPDIPPTTISSFIFWGLATPSQPYVWRTNLASNIRFVIEAEEIHLPGDYNLDGEVDAADYDTWQADFGSNMKLAADGNGNNVVDAADYAVWRDNLGASVESAATQRQVPEPTTAALLVAMAMLSILRRIRYSTLRE